MFVHDNTGIREIWNIIEDYVNYTGKTGYFEEMRKQQEVIRMHDTIIDFLTTSFYNNDEVKTLLLTLKGSCIKERSLPIKLLSIFSINISGSKRN